MREDLRNFRFKRIRSGGGGGLEEKWRRQRTWLWFW